MNKKKELTRGVKFVLFSISAGVIGFVSFALLDAFVKEAPQFDDLTMVGLKYNGPQENTQTEE